MFEQEQASSQEFTPLHRTIEWALGRYALTLKELKHIQDELQVAEETIELINQGLPDGFKVGTKTSWSPEVLRNGYGGYNKIFRPNESGEYVVAGEICTEGTAMPFLGDRILKTDDDLVIINDDLQLGLSVKEAVFVVDTVNDPSKRSIGGSQTERFEDELLPRIQQVPSGGKASFDCMYD